MNQKWSQKRAKPQPRPERPPGTRKRSQNGLPWPPFGLPLAPLWPPLASLWPSLGSLSPLNGHTWCPFGFRPPLVTPWRPFGSPNRRQNCTKTDPKTQETQRETENSGRRRGDMHEKRTHEHLRLIHPTPPGPERVYCRRQLRSFKNQSKTESGMKNLNF